MQKGVGGAGRNRTDDLLLAKQALSQLSYSPRILRSKKRLVGLGRFELPTSRLSGVRSNQLSYRPKHFARQNTLARQRLFLKAREDPYDSCKTKRVNTVVTRTSTHNAL